MIDPLLGASKPRLKLRCIFPEVMEQACEPRGFRKADTSADVLGAISHSGQMLKQWLPICPALVGGGVCVIHIQLKAESMPLNVQSSFPILPGRIRKKARMRVFCASASLRYPRIRRPKVPFGANNLSRFPGKSRVANRRVTLKRSHSTPGSLRGRRLQ